MDALGWHKDAREVKAVDHFLILNRNDNLIPAVARLNREQAALFFMLGETRGTSAGGAEEAGKFLRVPGTNPFFPLRHEQQGNRFLELMDSSDFEVYLLNTGRVGGKDEDERGKKVSIPYSSAIVKAISEGTIEWEVDPDFGYEVAVSLPGLDDPEILQPRKLYERQGRSDEYRALVDQLKRGSSRVPREVPRSASGDRQRRRVILGAADVEAARDLVLGFLTPRADRDWTAPVPDLEWDCETTLRHMISAQASYAAHLATQVDAPPRRAEHGGTGARRRCAARHPSSAGLHPRRRGSQRPSEARGLHASGMTDPSGYAAMSCDELLVHTWDIGRGLGDSVRARLGSCARGWWQRLFPMWLPIDADPRDAFLWCNGRVALPGRARLDGDWGWWSRPIEEWDGTDPDA